MSVPAIAVLVLFFGFTIGYMAVRAYDIITPNVDIMTLRLGNMENQQSIPGIIIRYEEVFRADKDGRVVFDVQEFDLVSGGRVVASIRDIEAMHQSEHDMALLQQEIINVHEMRHATQTDPEVARINTGLRNRMERSQHHHMQQNLSEIYNLLETLTQITYNRNRMIINESVNMRGSLNRQYEALTAQIEMNSSDIYATHSGIMSPLIDGLENYFTPDNMRQLNRAQVRMSVDLEAIIPGREVQEGDDVFKIVGNTWYVASWMPNEMAHGFTRGSERTIFLENATTGRFERIPMRIEYVSVHHNDTFVIFRSSRNVIEFLNQRSVNIRITDSVENGFRIPPSAIAVRRFFRIPRTHIHGTENYFIMHRREDVVQPVPIIIDEDESTETHAYILEDTLMLFAGDTLSPFDPTSIFHIVSDSDIEIVRGVYCTTFNYANFIVIDIEGEIPDTGGHILLVPERNRSLRQFNSIAVDAAAVRQGQVVR
jgi:flagellin-specific chaperone FliS